MMNTCIYRNKKFKIAMLTLIIVVVLIIGIIFYPKIYSNKNYTLSYGIQVTSHVNSSYTLYFPFPIYSLDTPIFNTSDIVELIGNVHNISLEKTDHGIALSVNASGTIFIGFTRNVSLETWRNSSYTGLSMWEEYKDDSRTYIVGKVWIYGSGFDMGDIYINLRYYHKSPTENKHIEDKVIETIIHGWNTYDVSRGSPPRPLQIGLLPLGWSRQQN